jgi:cytochrome oxidase assembly protein ShyY1
MDPSASHSEAVRLARGGELAPALAGLLAAWRAHRHPRIADLIDRVAERLPAAPMPARPSASATMWRALAKRKVAELSRLLRAL